MYGVRLVPAWTTSASNENSALVKAVPRGDAEPYLSHNWSPEAGRPDESPIWVKPDTPHRSSDREVSRRTPLGELIMNPPSLLVNRTSSPAVIASLHSLSRKSNSVRRTIKAAFALLGLLVFFTSNAGYSYAQQAGQLEMWVSNWRVQVFNDTRRPGIARSAIQLVTARNEYKSAQIVCDPRLHSRSKAWSLPTWYLGQRH